MRKSLKRFLFLGISILFLGLIENFICIQLSNFDDSSKLLSINYSYEIYNEGLQDWMGFCKYSDVNVSSPSGEDITNLYTQGIQSLKYPELIQIELITLIGGDKIVYADRKFQVFDSLRKYKYLEIIPENNHYNDIAYYHVKEKVNFKRCFLNFVILFFIMIVVQTVYEFYNNIKQKKNEENDEDWTVQDQDDEEITE